jgi:hypothetical protein
MAGDVTIEAAGKSASYRHKNAGAIWTDASTGYQILMDSQLDFKYYKTTDGGATWPTEVEINDDSRQGIAWWDQDTPGEAGTLIHTLMISQTGSPHAVYYRSIDTSDDSLGTLTTIEEVQGTGTLKGNTGMDNHEGSITKLEGGNLIVAGVYTDSGSTAFTFAYKSGNDGSTWSAIADPIESALDHWLLSPGNESDTNDAYMIYWDASADEISLKIYDDTADSWSETSIATSMVDVSNYLQMDAMIQHSDGKTILVAWSEQDATTADLLGWVIGGSSDIVAFTTDVYTNSAESAQCAITINQQNDDWYVSAVIGGTWASTNDVERKKSDDGGATWGTADDLSNVTDDLRAVWASRGIDATGGVIGTTWFNEDLDDYLWDTDFSISVAAVVAAGAFPAWHRRPMPLLTR